MLAVPNTCFNIRFSGTNVKETVIGSIDILSSSDIQKEM